MNPSPWSSILPTAAGYYWFRGHHGFRRVIEVAAGPDGELHAGLAHNLYVKLAEALQHGEWGPREAYPDEC